MDLAAGSHLGPNEIVSRLGAGGMGELFRARDPRLGREVAIFDTFSLIFGSAYAPGPDGQRFLVTEVVQSDEPRLIATLNWTTDKR